MLTGLYFTFSDAKPDVAFVNTDTAGGSNGNTVGGGSGGGGGGNPEGDKLKIPLPSAFFGGRATWRELIRAQ
ncbi:MAG: hypothetical protein WCG35_10045, partial [Betaproteobacteria bacterium]